jgi:hypothetical protein
MNKLRLILMTTSTLVLFAVCVFQAQAQATRTWVSGVGDDVNPCSRTAPCKTLAGAISKTAVNGEINAIDSGGFGAVTITKSITIDLSSVQGGVLTNAGNAINVNDSATANPGTIVVTLRGLDINGLGGATNGVRITSAKTVNIENSTIYGFTNGISDGRTTGGTLLVSDTIIRNNPNTNVALTTTSDPGVRAFLDKVQLKSAVAGLAVANGNTATITNSFINGNTSYGIVAFGANSTVTAKNCSISGNQTGVAINNGNPIIRISDLLITQNVTSLSIAGGSTGQILSFGDNKISGNTVDNPPSGIITQQ